ncbi:hypothetical protein BRC94_06125 [Halobacteriales archaeon QS_5_70_17]|nr:MAG: hypothetical protein BRC94_06125 [Halobacteriales archaeon QS_5_70_17]
MTDSIDLDDIEAESEEPTEDDRNRGDWFWRGEGDPEDEPAGDTGDVGPGSDGPTGPTGPGLETETDADADAEADGSDDASDAGGAIPRVPRENEDRPVGIPVESGGAGGADARRAGERDRERTLDPDADHVESESGNGNGNGSGDAAATAPRTPEAEPGDAGESGDAPATASGPHGGGVDDRTQAFTYRSLRRLEHLHTALADAESWSDWVGVVGDVPAHVINKFQRENQVDVDFFNGAGAGPGERLAEIGPSSMFYAERMVLVGLEDEAWMAEVAGWEFVPLAEAAEAAGWELTDADEGDA